MTVGKGKRPRDLNQLAAWTVAVSTGQIEPPEPPQPKQRQALSSEHMAEIGRKGGQIGGKRRLKTMTAEQRSKAAQKAANRRWKRRRKPR